MIVAIQIISMMTIIKIIYINEILNIPLSSYFEVIKE